MKGMELVMMMVVLRVWLMGEKKEGGNVRWIHKILADGPQNDDTLLFQANGGYFSIDRGPGCGPSSSGRGNATYDLKQPAGQQKKQQQQQPENQHESQPEQQERQEQLAHQEHQHQEQEQEQEQ